MTAVRGKIVGDVAVTIVHHPTPNIKYGDDPNGPPLKRLAPRRHPLNPAPPANEPPNSKDDGGGEQSKAKTHEESRDATTVLRGKIVHDRAIHIVHHPTPNIKYGDDPDGPPLKRLAPRRSPLNPAPPEEESRKHEQSGKEG